MNDLRLYPNQILESCGSTNDLAKALAERGYPHGTWVSSRIQETGRGRLAREWKSEAGNLFLSTLVQVENKSLWTWVPLTAAVAVVRCLSRKYPALHFEIKWPNDLYSNRQKLGGILCESSGFNSYIIIGIGMNCTHSPRGLDQETTDLSQARGILTTADDVRADIHTSLLDEVAHLVHQGPIRVIGFYNQWTSLRPGTEISWRAIASTQINPELQIGTVIGLGPSGELKVKTQDKIISIFSEDVKLHRANEREPRRSE